MLIYTTVLIAFLSGDAIGCNRSNKKTLPSCEATIFRSYRKSSFTCYGFLDKHCNASGCAEVCLPCVFLMCDCEDSSKWTNGSYSVDKVDYDTVHYKLKPVKPIVLAKISIPNCSGHVQSITFSGTKSITHTSSHSRTSGVSVQKGVTFKFTFPQVFEVGGSVSVTSNNQQTFGETIATVETHTKAYTCNGRPNKTTVCKTVMRKGVFDIPYTMTLKHKMISNCICESKGIWKGVQIFNVELQAKELSKKCRKQN